MTTSALRRNGTGKYSPCSDTATIDIGISSEGMSKTKSLKFVNDAIFNVVGNYVQCESETTISGALRKAQTICSGD